MRPSRTQPLQAQILHEGSTRIFEAPTTIENLAASVNVGFTSIMGRYDFRPLRVHQTATQLLSTERLNVVPPWYRIVGQVPPAQALVRTQPIQHHEKRTKNKARKPSKMFQPQTIVYEEDALRKEVFCDHPWELARPRVVLENDGKDWQKDDWSKILQPGRQVSGERFVPGSL